MSVAADMSAFRDPGASPLPKSVKSRLLFSLDGVDLSAVAADRARIARMNPHRQQMALLDRLVWHSPGFERGVGVKVARPDEFWVDGHLPARPLNPGVLMIESAAQLACYLYNARQRTPQIAAFTRLDDAVFRHSVEPGQELMLLSDEIQYSPRRFISAVQGIVEGRIAFEARITGMSLGDAEMA
jgi:3-hydroxyacyl-[acyl-carrier-protein] dehydratase